MFKRMTSLLFLSAVVFAACSIRGRASAARAPRRAPEPRSAASRRQRRRRPPRSPGGLLDKVLKAKKLVVSTDPNYAPQSFLKSDGTFEGFDIDVATEIAKRLGVEVDVRDARAGTPSPPARGAAAGTSASAR